MTAPTAVLRRAARRLRRPALVTRYTDELRLLPTRTLRALAVALAVAFAVLPFLTDDFVLTVLVFAGIFTIGALGLNLLTGYTGQVSLGHAFFMGTGAYAAAFFGAGLGLPLPVWLLLAAIFGGALGAAIGPFALRLRGLYLAFVSVGLVFVGLHVFGSWESLTGGSAGIGGRAPSAVGPLDFNALTIGGIELTKPQSWLWLTWALVALAALVTKNIVRGRPGRALQAIRDRDRAAAVIGVDLARYKVAAFALSSALAAVCGALYFGFVEYVSTSEWNLLLSIQFIAIMVVGGAGTVYGTVLGALFVVGLPRVIEEFSGELAFLEAVGLTVEELNIMIFGLLLVGFLVFEPRGLAALWQRARTYVTSWPYTY